MIKTTIFVEPVGKGRPRMTALPFLTAYTPQKTAHAENQIRDAVAGKFYPFTRGTPLRLEATFYRARPKSTKKSVVFPVSRPDWDNYAKLLMDALEKFAYENDSQIVTAIIKKRFVSAEPISGNAGATLPRIELEISEEVEL